MALSYNNGRTSLSSDRPAYLAEPLLQDWLLSDDDDQEPFNLGLLHEVLVFSDASVVGDFKDCWYEDQHDETVHALHRRDSAVVIDVFDDLDLDVCELFLAAETGAQASHNEPKNTGGYEILGIDVNELLLEVESTALANCDKTTEAEDSSEDSDDDVDSLLVATEVIGLPSDAEDDTKDADFDVSDQLHTEEVVALLSSDEHVDDGEEDLESLITKCAEILGPRLLRELREHIKTSQASIDPDIISRVHEACSYLMQPSHGPTELARAADWFRDTPNQSDKREMARLGTVANYQAAYDDQQARLAAGVGLRTGEVKLGKLSFSNISAHIKKLLGEIPGHVVPIPVREALSRIFDRLGHGPYPNELPPPAHLALAHRLLKLSPERLEVLEAIKALCAFILRHNPVLPKELAVVVLVYDVKTRLFQAAALAARRRLQEDVEAGLMIPAQRRRGGLGLRKLWRRLFRADDSAAGVYTAVNTADAVAEPSPVPATPPVASRVRKFRLPWMKPTPPAHKCSSFVASGPDSTPTQSKAPSHNARGEVLDSPSSTCRFRLPWKKTAAPAAKKPTVAAHLVVATTEPATPNVPEVLSPEEENWLLRETSVWNAVWGRMMTAGDGMF
ncbi:hypothetical protein HK405_008310 [Cladochytrium tenue]|nr:hypothetical protein HK405_008310 [Cladochytrium tenue]